jgi:hypothetical protein
MAHTLLGSFLPGVYGTPTYLDRPPSHSRNMVTHLHSYRIHNTYTLASAWHIVRNSLRTLQNDGLMDDKIKSQLAKSEHLRSHYLVLYDIVNVLVNISQAKFSVLATTTCKISFPPHLMTRVERILVNVHIQHTTVVTSSMLVMLTRMNTMSSLIRSTCAMLAGRLSTLSLLSCVSLVRLTRGRYCIRSCVTQSRSPLGRPNGSLRRFGMPSATCL